MKKEELIQKINNEIPAGAEVVIFDHRKNLDSDGSGAGIHHHFEVVNFAAQEPADGFIPYAALVFENEDYDDPGLPDNSNSPFGECKLCKGSGLLDVIAMGTDLEYIECECRRKTKLTNQ